MRERRTRRKRRLALFQKAVPERLLLVGLFGRGRRALGVALPLAPSQRGTRGAATQGFYVEKSERKRSGKARLCDVRRICGHFESRDMDSNVYARLSDPHEREPSIYLSLEIWRSRRSTHPLTKESRVFSRHSVRWGARSRRFVK